MADLRIWAAVVAATVVPLPIPSRPLPPSYSAIQFVSDAAGARYVKVKRKRVPCETPGVRGLWWAVHCTAHQIYLIFKCTVTHTQRTENHFRFNSRWDLDIVISAQGWLTQTICLFNFLLLLLLLILVPVLCPPLPGIRQPLEDALLEVVLRLLE